MRKNDGDNTDVLTDDTADLVLTLILMICRKINVAQQKIMNRVWRWGKRNS